MGRRAVPIRNIAWGLLALTATACSRPPEGVVDLSKRPWRVMPGFPADDREGTTAIVRRPPIPLGGHEPHPDGPIREYSVEVTFHSAELSPAPLRGLLVSAVGEAAEIYLNGKRVAGEIWLDENGALAARKVRRRWLVPLPNELIKPGVNQVVFHVAGDAPLIDAVPNLDVGFQRATGYFVGDFESLRRASDDWAAIGLVGFHLAFGLFALALAIIAGGRTLMTLGAFALLLAAHTATQSVFVADWFSDTTTLQRGQFAALFLASCAFLIFFNRILGRGATLTRFFVALWGTLALLAALAPYPVVPFLVRLWQVSVLASFVGTVRLMVQTLRDGNREIIGYVPALSVLSFTVAWDIAMSLSNASDISLAPVGTLLFVGALGINHGSRFLRIHRAAESADTALAHTQDRLAAFFNATLEATCLREGNFIVEVNPAFTRLFGYSPEEVAGMPFTQLFAAESQPEVTRVLEDGTERNEALAVRHDGSTFDAELEHRPLGVMGQALSVTAIRDVTQRKAAAMILRERNLELEALNQRMVDRELQMIDLKREIRSLEGKGEEGNGGRGAGPA